MRHQLQSKIWWAQTPKKEPYLAEEALRAAECLGRVLSVAHLHAGEGQRGAVLRADLNQRIVTIAVGCVVVACRQLGCMAARAVPPVDASNFEADLHRCACWLLGHPHSPAASQCGTPQQMAVAARLSPHV